MRRIISVLAAMAVVAAMVAVMAMPAFAAQKSPPAGCTFAKGTTTCVTTVTLESTTYCLAQPSGTRYLQYLRETFGETTTTYKAKSGTFINTSYRIHQTDTLKGVVNDCAA